MEKVLATQTDLKGILREWLSWVLASEITENYENKQQTQQLILKTEAALKPEPEEE